MPGYLERFSQDYNNGISAKPETGRLNLALMSSLRQLIKNEGVGQVGKHQWARRLMGTAEYLGFAIANSNNPISNTYNLVMIVTDDLGSRYVNPYPAGRPWRTDAYTVIRDENDEVASTPSLDSLVYNTPSAWRKVEKQHKNRRAEEKILWEENLASVLDLNNVDVLLLDGLKANLGTGIPDDRGIFPAYEGRIVEIQSRSSGDRYDPLRNKSSLFVAGRGNPSGDPILSLELISGSAPETEDSFRYRIYTSNKNPAAAAGLYEFAFRPETSRLVKENRERIDRLHA